MLAWDLFYRLRVRKLPQSEKHHAPQGGLCGVVCQRGGSLVLDDAGKVLWLRAGWVRGHGGGWWVGG